MASRVTDSSDVVGGASPTNNIITTNSQFSNNHNNLTPSRTPSTTVGEPPIPTSNYPTTPSNTKISPSLNQEHRQCIINMEAIHSDVFAAPVHGVFDFVRSFVQIIAHVLSYGITRAYFGVSVVLSMVSLKVFAVFFVASIVALVFFVAPSRHRAIISHGKTPKKIWPRKEITEKPFYVVLICGSGGHTAEMIKMVERSIRSEGPNSHRRWAIGYGDELSYKRVMAFERHLNSRFTVYNLHAGTYDIRFFHRSRAVHQSWWTTPFTVYDCTNDVFDILADRPPNPAIPENKFPGVIASDGPGTGFVFLLCAYLMKFFGLAPDDSMKGVFVESWARVNSLSFSGQLIKYFDLAEVFVVQHPPLHRRYPGQAYTGNMVAMPTIPSVPLEPLE